MSMSGDYRPIADYGLIGDSRTAALVSRDGSIDWLCCPRFDSPAIFSRILDATKGGFFRISPSGEYEVTRSYLEDTNVLSTTFQTNGGSVRLLDFMPVPNTVKELSDRPPRILRLVEGLRGQCDLRMQFQPRFNFSELPLKLEHAAGRIVASGRNESLLLAYPPALEVGREDASTSFTVSEGERLWFAFEYVPPNSAVPSARGDEQCEAGLAETLAYWQEWISGCAYEGPYAAAVRRSALALKLLIYGPSGAIIAAPTTSLPEDIGGERNWDYRFSWLRDASLTLSALMRLGFHDEAMAYFDWFESLCIQCQGDLQIAYRVDGGTEMDERVLDGLAGYRDSHPVRTGNAAAMQLQLDIYGHVLDAAHYCYTHMRQPHPPLWSFLSFLADEVCQRWAEPDHGIWEARAEPRHYLSSKLMCWVALDRAVRLAEKTNLAGDADKWRRVREDIRGVLLGEGYSKELTAFTQVIGGTDLDASALAIPLVGFLPGTDNRVIASLERIEERLSRDGLVYRYLAEDGMSGGEAAFLLCSFWFVDNLALQGRVEKARQWFERLCGYANDLGLLSEEVEPKSGELLGNYPQAFTHLALIRSALSIQEAELSRTK